jgi:ribosomal protein L7/L12
MGNDGTGEDQITHRTEKVLAQDADLLNAIMPVDHQVELVKIGPNKIPVVHVVGALFGLAMPAAYQIVNAVEAHSVMLKNDATREQAQAMKAALEEHGAVVTITAVTREVVAE